MNVLTNGWKAKLSRNEAARALLYPGLLINRAIQRRRMAQKQQCVDNLREYLAEDPVVHLKDFLGSFEIDRRSHLFARIVTLGHYEPLLARKCLQYLDRDRDAIDVGANVGFHAVLFAKSLPSGRVLAIEPTVGALEKLRANAKRNDTQHQMIIFNGVASDTKGMCELHVIPGKEEYSSLGPMIHPSIRSELHGTHQVQAETVDSLVSLHKLNPGFIKIDVEGSEYKVLEGATETLTRHRPIVISELSDALLRRNGTSAASVVSYMRRLGYRVLDPLSTDSTGARLLDYSDMLCIPEDTLA